MALALALALRVKSLTPWLQLALLHPVLALMLPALLTSLQEVQPTYSTSVIIVISWQLNTAMHCESFTQL
jgi:hypothetical protein